MSELTHFGGSQSLIRSAAAGNRKVEKGTALNPNFVQIKKESAQKLFAEAGSNSAGKFKFLTFVEADKQRTKMLPGLRVWYTRR